MNSNHVIKAESQNVLIHLLAKEYRSANTSILQNRLGEISQDYMKRGLYNSTVHVTALLGAQFDFVRNLLEFICNKLLEDFPKQPLKAFHDELEEIIEQEFKRIPSTINTILIQAGLTNSFKGCHRCIDQELDKLKQDLDRRIQLDTLRRKEESPKTVEDTIDLKFIRINWRALWSKMKKHFLK
ncbi:MAG: hypothetical protein JW828_13835 [Sedimentisphaerales bacterium]|nr:hypothetical protein [Sedimentisphaerales bacterium]